MFLRILSSQYLNIFKNDEYNQKNTVLYLGEFYYGFVSNSFKFLQISI